MIIKRCEFWITHKKRKYCITLHKINTGFDVSVESDSNDIVSNYFFNSRNPPTVDELLFYMETTITLTNLK